MRARFYHFYHYGYVFLSVIAILSVYLVWQLVIHARFEKPGDPRTPDAFIKNMHIFMTDQTGQQKYQFISPHMQHYAEHNRTTFDAPLLLIHSDNPVLSPWQITARQGESLQGDQVIRLMHQVLIQQASNRYTPACLIRTDSLNLYPKEKFIQTADPVSGTRENIVLQSKGIKIDFHQERLFLLADAHVIYRLAKQPSVDIRSEKATFDQQRHWGQFSGHAVVKQAYRVLSANNIDLYLDKQNRVLLKLIAQSVLNKQVIFTDKTQKNTDFLGKADKMVYLPLQHTVRLLGHAMAKQGENDYHAPQIDYNIDQQTVISKKGRVSMTILPASLSSHQETS